VVVDVDRVATLMQRLSHTSTAATKSGGINMEKLNAASQRVAQRLKALLTNVNIPPQLPPILFGY